MQNNPKTNSLARRVFFSLVGVVAVLVTLHLVFQYLNLEVYNEKQGQIFELSNRVDFDDEVSLPTWFSQFLLLAIGATALLIARFEKAKSRRRAWTFIGVAGVLMSIDEVGSIHEFILQSAHLAYYGEIVPTAAVNAWVLALPFIAVGGILFLWWMYRTLPLRTVVLLMISGVVYLTGAAGLELFSNDFAKTSFMYQGTMTALEESLEMIGSIMVLATVVSYLEVNHAEKLKALGKLLSRQS